MKSSIFNLELNNYHLMNDSVIDIQNKTWIMKRDDDD